MRDHYRRLRAGYVSADWGSKRLSPPAVGEIEHAPNFCQVAAPPCNLPPNFLL